MSKQTYSSPMSFIGSTRRLSGWARSKGAWAWPLAVTAMLGMWCFLLCWYVVVFGIFGLVTIPFRFFRRGQRKSLAIQQEQLRVMQEMQKTAPTP